VTYVGWTIILICALAAGTLFFSVNVMALRRFSRVRLQEAFRRAGKEKSAENLTDRLAGQTEELILTCSLYRLILNMSMLLLLVGLFVRLHEGGPFIRDYVVVFIVAVVVFAIFSVALPHAWAKYAAENVLCRTHALLRFFAKTAWPILYMFSLHDGLVRRLAGVVEATPQEQQEEKQEEFLSGLEQRRMEGVVDEEEQEMIENVLELSETTAGEIMTPRTDIVALDADAPLKTVIDTINRAGHTRVPVFEANIDNIIGLVYAKDLLAEVGKPAGDFRLRDKIREAYFVPETKSLRALLHEFQNEKLHIAVVLDEYGGTAGIVTLEDILEELVGEITDEYEKTPSKRIKRIDENTMEADARTYVDDLNDEFELKLPEDEDYDTVGGFVFSHLGYIPKAGETFDYQNLKFTITAAEARKIKRIRIQKIPRVET